MSDIFLDLRNTDVNKTDKTFDIVKLLYAKKSHL